MRNRVRWFLLALLLAVAAAGTALACVPTYKQFTPDGIMYCDLVGSSSPSSCTYVCGVHPYH